jgi:hypothetical protein
MLTPPANCISSVILLPMHLKTLFIHSLGWLSVVNISAFTPLPAVGVC